MRAALLLLWLAATAPSPAGNVVVQNGETWAQLAKRAMGDEKIGPELQALNAPGATRPEVGSTLKLPGPERQRAVSALSAAKHAVSHAADRATSREEAKGRLHDAETLLRQAKYVEAAKSADAAWQLVSAEAQEATKFAVQVEEDGRTHVSAESGRPIRVEAQGVEQAVYAGQEATIERGKAPTVEGAADVEDPVLTAPALVSPQDTAAIKFKGQAGGLGPLRVSWTPVAGATGYEVEVVAGGGKPWVVTSPRAEARLPLLNEGKYRWWVRSLGANGARSPPSVERTFELHPEPIKLEVRGTTWK